MYQIEMFDQMQKAQGWNKFLAGGGFARVYTKEGSDWVIKVGQNDGTRTYLEWVMLKRVRGEFMKGMPLIDWLVPIGEERYMVAMKRYGDANGVLRENHFLKPQYIWDLMHAFEHETGMLANDCHASNIMAGDWRNEARLDDLILTDPCSAPYQPLGDTRTTRADNFELATQ